MQKGKKISMDGLLQSKFFIKLQDFGQKLGQNKFLTSLQAAMMSLMAVIMIGAVSQIAVSVLGPQIMGVIQPTDYVYYLLDLPYQFTMNTLSIWVVIFFAYSYAKSQKIKSPLNAVVNASVCFFLVATAVVSTEAGKAITMSYLGAQGMFIGFIVVYITVKIELFCIKHNIRIKMPDQVPPFLSNSFSSILPLFFSSVLFVVLIYVVNVSTGGAYTICSGFMALLSTPLKALTSLPGMFILCTFGTLLWCFGIHGTIIVGSVITPLALQAIADNAAAYAAGEPLSFYPVLLFGMMRNIGGSGNTLPLVFMGLKSKSKQISAISKVSLVPGIFRINEPLTFGLPIMYNPILCIPFVLNVPIVMFLTYLAYELNLISPAFISISALLPLGMGNYLTTLDWRNFVWDYVLLIPLSIIYYPFFKVYEKKLIEKETQELKAKEMANEV